MPKILVVPGDGIGVEVTEISVSILKAVGERNGIEFTLESDLLGGCAIDAHGVPVTEETIERAKKSDAVLLGAVGGPKWENLEHHLKPERGLLELRKRLDTFANLRPAIVYAALAEASTLKREVVEGGRHNGGEGAYKRDILRTSERNGRPRRRGEQGV